MPGRTRELWLSCRVDGRFMLGHVPPVRAEGTITGKEEIWSKPGDELQVPSLCPLSVRLIFGVKLQPGEAVLVRIHSEIVGDPHKVEWWEEGDEVMNEER